MGQLISGSISSASRSYSNTCASGYAQAGRDVVYKLRLTPADRVRIELDGTGDMSVYVVAETAAGGDCNINRCYTGMDANFGAGLEVIPWFTPPVTGWYYIIVDAYNRNLSANFTLRVTPVCYPDEAGRPCNDHSACTVDDTCQPSGSCVGVEPSGCGGDGECDDGDLCNGAEQCVNGECVAGTPLGCDDGDACNGAETCDALLGCQAGTPLSCDDGDVCNGAETCDPGTGCQGGTPLGCDDGDACNGAETCHALLGCQAGAPLSCDDGNVCNGAETCDPGTGCQGGTPLSCDDGDACNGAETCDALLGCRAGTPPLCDDHIACTVDVCDPVSGGCTHTPDHGACDDGLTCTGAEVCDVDYDCQPGTDPCDDPCTVDFCDEALGCSNQPLACDDGDACTADACFDGVCVSDAVVCDDGLFCNGVETCDPTAGCQTGTPVDCDDGVDCTLDACDETADACTHAPNHAVCEDGFVCNGAEVCDPTAGCVSGDPAVCDDGDSCTDDTCDEGLGMCLFTDNGTCSGTTCGDGVCEGGGEDCNSCRTDCRCAGPSCRNGCCGDGVCSQTENASNCKIDCAP